MDGDIVFFGILAWLIGYFIIKVVENVQFGTRTPSNKEMKKHTIDRVALKNKHKNNVPLYDEKGKPNTTIKQAYNKQGIYSKEYGEEHKKLESDFNTKYKQK